MNLSLVKKYKFATIPDAPVDEHMIISGSKSFAIFLDNIATPNAISFH